MHTQTHVYTHVPPCACRYSCAHACARSPVCIHPPMCMHLPTCAHTCTHMHAGTHVHVHVHRATYACTYPRVHAYPTQVCMRAQPPTCMHLPTCAHTPPCVCRYLCAHACARSHVCMHTPQAHAHTHVCPPFAPRSMLTTEMLASPMAGVAPALHTTSWPWHTLMAAMRLEGRVAALTSLSPLPHAAAATSQKKAKQTVTQKSCGCGAGLSASAVGWEPCPPPGPYRERELLVVGVKGMEAQVEHQGRHGVEEGEDPQGHKELGGGGEVAHQVQRARLRLAITLRHLEGDLVQPGGSGAGGWLRHPESGGDGRGWGWGGDCPGEGAKGLHGGRGHEARTGGPRCRGAARWRCPNPPPDAAGATNHHPQGGESPASAPQRTKAAVSPSHPHTPSGMPALSTGFNPASHPASSRSLRGHAGITACGEGIPFLLPLT